MERIGLEPGTEIGGYRIVHQLGAGAMGVVYRAIDGGGTPVAFKILRSSILDAEELRERLIREASSLRKVSHPAVAALLDVEIDADETFIVTELVEGPTLEAFVADNGPLNLEQLHNLAQRLGSALKAVHDAGVVHRDLKPNNVLMGNDGPVLIDFGIAHGMQDQRLTATGLVVGTPGYLAPELVNGADPSRATDEWGLAAVLTFAATGRAPFGYGGFEAVLSRAMAGKPDVDGLDERVAYALRGALAVAPEHRWSIRDVVDELKESAETPGAFPLYYASQDTLPTQVVGAPTDEYDNDQTVVRPAASRSTQATDIVENQDGRTAVFGAPPLPPSFAPETGASAVPQPSDPWNYSTFDESDGVHFPQHTTGHVDGAELLDESDSYQRTRPARRVVPFLAGAIAVIVFSCWAPFLTIGVLSVILMLFSVVGTSWDAFQSKREAKGMRKREGLLATLAFPWHFLKGAAIALPSLLFSAVMSLVVGAGSYFLARNVLGYIPREFEDPIPRTVWILLAGGISLLFLILSWYGPITATTRVGGRLVMQALFPGSFATMILVLILLGGAAYAGFVVWEGASVVWTPLQQVLRIGT